MRTLILSMLVVAGLVPVMPAHSADPAPAATPANATGPQELMESVAQALLDELEKNREALRNDPAALRRSSTSTCCRISTPTTPVSSCSASTGGRRPRPSASVSSTPSTSR